MKKVFLYLMIVNFIFANVTNLKGTYEVTYGFFGKMGEAKTSIKVDANNNYTIHIKAYATGFASSISGGLTETYISKGKVIDGKFRPNTFSKATVENNKKKYYFYTFDYNKKQITKEYRREKKVFETKLDINDISSYARKRESHWKKSHSKKTLDFWTNEDILSLFFNIKDKIKSFPKGVKRHLTAVGAGETKKGRIDILVPSGNEYKQLKESLDIEGTNNIFFKVFVYNKLFASKKGELYMSLDKDGLCNKSMLKDVLFFGDVEGVLKRD